MDRIDSDPAAWFEQEFATASIEAVRGPIVVYELADGSLTADRGVAVADLPQRRRRDHQFIQECAGQLRERWPLVRRRTPARIAILRRLGDEGVISRAVAERAAYNGRLDDVAWRAVRLLVAYLEPTEREVDRWTVTVDLDVTVADATVALDEVIAGPQSEYEPFLDGAGESPRDLLRELTGALVADGWRVTDDATLAVSDSGLDDPSRVVWFIRERATRPELWAGRPVPSGHTRARDCTPLRLLT